MHVTTLIEFYRYLLFCYIIYKVCADIFKKAVLYCFQESEQIDSMFQ